MFLSQHIVNETKLLRIGDPMSTHIQFRLSDSALDNIHSCDTRETRGRLLLTMMNEKIEAFQAWSRKNLGEEMTKFEIAAIRTFLYKELTGELDGKSDIMSLPRVSIEHPASMV